MLKRNVLIPLVMGNMVLDHFKSEELSTVEILP